jgi:nuclear autoantigenic sperm protein
MFTEAMQLRRSDPVAAVALFKAVLAARVAQHGEMALQCASAYMQYGMALFEQAQFSADILGDTVRQAADERAEQVVAEELAEDAAEEGKPEDAAAAAGPSTSTPAAAADGGSPSKQQQQPMDAEDAAAESEDADEDDQNEGEEQQQEEGEEGEEADDMQLAWENLEVARIIYEKEGGLDAHASEIAEIHNFTGDIFCEQEKFEEAIQEYRKCAAVLAATPGGEDARRAAEVYFKLSLALQYNDQAAEALEAVQTAKTKLQAHLEGLVSKLALARGAPASTTPTADAAFAALAAAVASYTPPKAPAAAADDAQQQQQDKEAAQLEEEVGDIKAVLADLEDKVEELQAILKDEISMKDTLRQAFKACAAAEGDSGEGGSSGAGPVQDLGVVGKGKRVAPTPAAAGGGSSGSAPEAAGSKPKRSLEDLMGGPVPGGATSIGFGASKANVAAAAAGGGGAAAAEGGAAAEVAVKKVKTSAAAGAAAGVENQQQAQ